MNIIPFDSKKTKKVTKTKATKVKGFNTNGELINKRKAREMTADKIIESNVVGTIISLPHTECEIETQILERNPNFNFIGVERDLPTFNRMAKFLAEANLTSKITPIFGEMSTLIKNANEGQYAHLILDYCNWITMVHEEISIALSRNIVAIGGTIALTINKRFIHTDFIRHMEKLCPYDKATSEYKTHTEHIIAKLILAKGGVGQYETIVSFEYNDPKGEQIKGANMILVIVKRLY
jgi:hypothetical protein